jgi:signal transduction histidine kinase
MLANLMKSNSNLDQAKLVESLTKIAKNDGFLSLRDILELDTKILDNMIFQRKINDQKIEASEAFESEDIVADPYTYMKIKVKKYRMNGEENCLVQMIDETKNILYQNSQGKNKFLQIINATVSHELKNPLNAIIS